MHIGEVSLVKWNEGSQVLLVLLIIFYQLGWHRISQNFPWLQIWRFSSPEWNVHWGPPSRQNSDLLRGSRNLFSIYFLTGTFEIRAAERNNSPLIPSALRSFCSQFCTGKIISVAMWWKHFHPWPNLIFLFVTYGVIYIFCGSVYISGQIGWI